MGDVEEIANASGAGRDEFMSGFGMSQIKQEGAEIHVDAAYQTVIGKENTALSRENKQLKKALKKIRKALKVLDASLGS